ncbi:hypothetical protein GCM10029964_088980 [Kibdelosporangium lantanae]
MPIWPGTPYPLGATYDGVGTNFAVFSETAYYVELCLIDRDGSETRMRLPEIDGFVHHGYVNGVGPGQRYGYRVHGPWDVIGGTLANPAKLLSDPYGKATAGELDWDDSVYGYERGFSRYRPNARDSAGYVPISVVHDPFFDWGNDRRPRTPYNESVIYQAHVRGMTISHPGLPPQLRGTYAGLVDPAVVRHLTRLGVTAVNLMPVHAFVSNRELVDRGLHDYWGYNTLGFFAPHRKYSASTGNGAEVQEFKRMVLGLHEASIEVIVDIAYGHTGEGDHLGPTLSMRGIDNPAYYRLVSDDPRYYVSHPETGNVLDVVHPQVLQLLMDSLRYWVTEMHVDGFRFSSAADPAADRLGRFFDMVQQDPVIGQVKLIGDADTSGQLLTGWTLASGVRQIGTLPWLWGQWNDSYRDVVRDFWRGRCPTAAVFATRFTGSIDLYEGRRPFASINFVTAHHGFTRGSSVL